MSLIRMLQAEHLRWVKHNFPNQIPHQPLLGMVEEVGELSHAHLKEEQGIRGMTGPEVMDAKIDALGDLFIYMMSYANSNNIDLEAAITDTWAKVSKRDWIDDPQAGGE